MTVEQFERARIHVVEAARRAQPAAVHRSPHSFPLDVDVDVEPLAAEVDAALVAEWSAQRTTGTGRLVSNDDPAWRVLALRSVGGDPERTDAGGAEFAPVDWTPHAGRFPRITGFLRSLPLELQAVRLMALTPGGKSPEHVDTCTGLPWGRLRLHLPLCTSPAALVVFDGDPVHWDRKLWYGGFSRPHFIQNGGPETRIHLVIDGAPTDKFLSLVPGWVQERLHPDDILVPSPLAPAPPGHAALLPDEFEVPAAFLSLSAPDQEYLTSTATVRVRPHRVSDTALSLSVSDGRQFLLLRIGTDEYRVHVWPHRGMAFFPTPSGVAVQLRSRVGSVRSSLTLPGAVGRNR